MASFKKEISFPKELWDAIDVALDGRQRSPWMARIIQSSVTGHIAAPPSKVSPAFNLTKLSPHCRKLVEARLAEGKSIEDIMQSAYDSLVKYTPKSAAEDGPVPTAKPATTKGTNKQQEQEDDEEPDVNSDSKDNIEYWTPIANNMGKTLEEYRDFMRRVSDAHKHNTVNASSPVRVPTT